MKYDFPIGNANADNLDAPYFLIGLINRFNNSFQAAADAMFDELSWKQIFFMNCIALFEETPTIKDLSELLGCSHQNSRQILTKLEKQGFVTVRQDEEDKRKQRITLTEKAVQFRQEYDEPSEAAMQSLFCNVSKEELMTTINVFTKLNQNVDELKRGME